MANITATKVCNAFAEKVLFCTIKKLLLYNYFFNTGILRQHCIILVRCCLNSVNVKHYIIKSKISQLKYLSKTFTQIIFVF